ncbi:PqiB family protein [Marinivivus vitaminiproducens]|uniref:PqiB family protein n=1 Tax=Marinivivus vitaminiproducens TaxID=3035935 RepID=UPI0027A27807|nr:MlaD family protein [Geminicoccaceae bacterium SCSIO 64248]
MADDPETPAPQDIPEASVARRRGPSIVWIIPVVALAIALWLGYRSWSEMGSQVTLTFETAEGLEPGRTVIRYKDVDIGQVEAVDLSEDLSQIVVTARVDTEMDPYLNEGTRFWIVRPRIGAGGISGLGTLVSGAYVEMDPGEGEATRSFMGLEDPPTIRSNVPGRSFILRAQSGVRAPERGAPVYFQEIEVGQVQGSDFDPATRQVDIHAFVRAPYDELVHSGSRFWNAAGFSVELGSDGVHFEMTSVQALVTGGIAFDSPEGGQGQAEENSVFPLYQNYSSVESSGYTERMPLLVYLDGSVRGLAAGGSVEFRGIRVGTITDVGLDIDPQAGQARAAVTIQIEPQRIDFLEPRTETDEDAYVALRRLVEKGLRAQIRSGNLLTGEQVVALDFFPDEPPSDLVLGDRYPVMPSVPNEFDSITSSVTEVMNQIASLPLDQMVGEIRTTVRSVDGLVGSPEAQAAVASLGQAAQEMQATMRTLNAQSGPLLEDLRRAAAAADTAIVQAGRAMAAVDGALGENAPLRYDANAMIRELTAAARSVQQFADYLNRNPDALLRGRRGGGGYGP